MARRKLIYEGKAKILYEGPEPGLIVQYYKDDASRGAAEVGTITGNHHMACLSAANIHHQSRHIAGRPFR